MPYTPPPGPEGWDAPSNWFAMPLRCSVCRGDDKKNANGDPEALVKCATCKHHFHPTCIKLGHIADVIRSYAWRCNRHSKCEVCNKDDDEEHYHYCHHCDRAWHTTCLKLKGTPNNDWKCPTCLPPLPALPVPIRQTVSPTTSLRNHRPPLEFGPTPLASDRFRSNATASGSGSAVAGPSQPHRRSSPAKPGPTPVAGPSQPSKRPRPTSSTSASAPPRTQPPPTASTSGSAFAPAPTPVLRPNKNQTLRVSHPKDLYARKGSASASTNTPSPAPTAGPSRSRTTTSSSSATSSRSRPPSVTVVETHANPHAKDNRSKEEQVAFNKFCIKFDMYRMQRIEAAWVAGEGDARRAAELLQDTAFRPQGDTQRISGTGAGPSHASTSAPVAGPSHPRARSSVSTSPSKPGLDPDIGSTQESNAEPTSNSHSDSDSGTPEAPVQPPRKKRKVSSDPPQAGPSSTQARQPIVRFDVPPSEPSQSQQRLSTPPEEEVEDGPVASSSTSRPTLDWSTQLSRIRDPARNSTPRSIAQEHYAIGVDSGERRFMIMGHELALDADIERMERELERKRRERERLREYNDEWDVLEGRSETRREEGQPSASSSGPSTSSSQPSKKAQGKMPARGSQGSAQSSRAGSQPQKTTGKRKDRDSQPARPPPPRSASPTMQSQVSSPQPQEDIPDSPQSIARTSRASSQGVEWERARFERFNSVWMLEDGERREPRGEDDEGGGPEEEGQ
ncbi:hypothetical protein PENSPDRAFT_25522 [Peniophora sp. CONT]|nr:hypothetical protein PENSPDRAFT_25522 [Peniophora sp. CONT]